MEQNHLPNTPHSFFDNGETEYRYFSKNSMDNNQSMQWFIDYVGLSEYIIINDGTQVVFEDKESKEILQVDAGGLGDFYSHKYEVTEYEKSKI